MKKYRSLLVLFIFIVFSISAQTQQGYVKTRGRLVNGNVVAGQRLSGATVQVKGRNAVVTNANGAFSFPVPSNRFVVQSVKKKGYELVDPEAIARQYAYSSNPLVFVLETPDQLMEDKLANERRIRRTLDRQLHAKEDEIEALREQNKITQEEYRKALQELYAQKESNEKLIRDMVERYSQIDYDQLDEFNQRISDCILNGRLTEADSLLRSKGDMKSRIAAIHQEEEIEAAEAAELAQRQENLEKSKAGTRASKEETAKDCYSFYERFLMEHQNDSAAYYLELRASLDTTNVEWQMDAGLFIEEYLAKYDLAMEYYQNGLNQSLMQYGNQSEWVARFFNDMGSVYIDQGNSVKALDCYLKAKGIREYIFGTEHQSTASIYHNIGYVYAHQGNDSLALEYHKQALYIQKQTLGEVNHSVATSYNSIGTIYMRNGDYTNALHYLLNALAIYEEVLGKEHQDVAATNSNIAYAYCYIGNHHNALEHAQRALQIQEDIFGKLHPSIALTYNCLGFIYDKQRDYQNALECYQKALKIRELFFDTNHPDIATSYNNIGGIYYRQKDFDLALEYFQKAITINEQHPELLTASMAMPYNNVGNIYYQKGYYDTAMVYYQKALEIREHVLAKDSPDIADSYISIGNVYHKTGNGIMALDFHQKALVIRINSFGLMHRDVAQSHYNIAVIYYYQGNFTKALENFEQALDIRERILGIDDPSTQKAREKVELTRQKLQNQ